VFVIIWAWSFLIFKTKLDEVTRYNHSLNPIKFKLDEVNRAEYRRENHSVELGTQHRHNVGCNEEGMQW
jgi:type II secretory pathway component PulJ